MGRLSQTDHDVDARRLLIGASAQIRAAQVGRQPRDDMIGLGSAPADPCLGTPPMP